MRHLYYLFYSIFLILGKNSLYAQEQPIIIEKAERASYSEGILSGGKSGDRSISDKSIPDRLLSIPSIPLRPLTPLPSNQYDGSTQGDLSVGATGNIQFNLPFSIPTGINGVTPTLSLTYNSQEGNGIAGWGWNFKGVSSISRVGKSLYYDNAITSVSFSKYNDKFMLDGQRLLVKSGNYGYENSTYQTATFSNIKITAMGVSPYGSSYGPMYFEVLYPSGEKAYYGKTEDSRTKTNYALSYWENAQGLRIDYKYMNYGDILFLKEILYGSKNIDSHPYSIKINYKKKNRPEILYIGGEEIINQYIVDNININSEGVLYRKYQFEYDINNGYERLISVQESVSGNSAKEPIYFSYNADNKLIKERKSSYKLETIDNINVKNSSIITADIDGDKSTDVVLYPTEGEDAYKKIYLFNNINTNENKFVYGIKLPKKFDKIFPANILLSNNSLPSYQGLVTAVKNDSNIVFTTYIQGLSSPLMYQYDKEWELPKYYSSTFCGNYEENFPGYDDKYFNSEVCTQKSGDFNIDIELEYSSNAPIKYISGDFNGNGITDILGFEVMYNQDIYYTTKCSSEMNYYHDESNERFYRSDNGKCYIIRNASFGGDVYFIELDRRKKDNYIHSIGSLYSPLKSTDIIEAIDINGDGKQDIVQITNGKISIYEYNNRLRHLQSYSNNKIKTNSRRPIMGDYNGDGKIDFLIPTDNDSSRFILLTYTGTGFKITEDNYPFVYRDNYRDYHKKKTNSSFWSWIDPGYVMYYADHYYNLIPIDINGDGKTDIIDFKTSVRDKFKEEDRRTITVYENIYSGNEKKPINFKYALQKSLKAGDMPHLVFTPVDKPNRYIDLGILEGKEISFFEYYQNIKESKLIKRVKQNGIQYDITYLPMLNQFISDGSGLRREEEPIYSISSDQIYPYVNIGNMSSVKLVSQIDRTGAGIPHAQQKFRYHDAISHQKLGFIGFKATARSNFFNPDNIYEESLYTQTQIDPHLRGVVKQEFTVEGELLDIRYQETPNTYTSYSENSYSDISEGKVFKLKKESSTTINNLTQTTNVTNYEYDEYLNPTMVISSSGAVENIERIEYYSKSSTPYRLGYPKKKITERTIDGDTFTTQERWEYKANGLISKHFTKGNNTNEQYNTYTYDKYGNITQKIFTAENGENQTESYTYDSSGCYLLSSTDNEEMTTYYTYDTTRGWLLSKTNPYGQTTTYTYDDWGRNIKETDFLGKNTHTSFEYYFGENIIIQENDEGGKNVKIYNKLGLLKQQANKNPLGQMVSVYYEYDAQGRKIAQSQPSFSKGYNKDRITYDRYGRIVETQSASGKTVTFTYNGLTTTTNDNGKITTITKNTAGKTIKLQDPGGTITYTYFGNGEMKTANYKDVTISVEQDGWGRKTKITDPSAGVYTYQYNAFGQLTQETSPKGTTTYSYVPGSERLQQKVLNGDHMDMTISYTYNADKQLSSITNENDTYIYKYDNYKRLEKVKETHFGASFTKNYVYDDFGRILTEESIANIDDKSAQATITYIYANGAQTEIKKDNQTIWSISSIDAFGNVTEAQKGGITEQYTFTKFGMPLSQKVLKKNSELLSQTYNFDPIKQLLISRNNSFYNKQENFMYDTMERLISWGNQNETPYTHTYDERGRITENSSLGNYTYNGNSYQQASLLTHKSNEEYNPLISVSYTMLKTPFEIHKEGKERISYKYNAFGERAIADYGNENTQPEARPYRRYYSHDGSMEIMKNRQNGELEILLYLSGTPYSAPAVLKSNGQQSEILYLHRDYLGSIVMLTDNEGNAVEKRHFDAWGNLDKYWNESGATTIPIEGILLGRGYTGHEHLLGVGLIHMNGRLYDPILHRFLMPDNYVQDPFNTQNFNRYGYVLNNPLKYTDPSGEFIFTILSAIFCPTLLPMAIQTDLGWITGGIGSMQNGGSFLEGAAIGGLNGAINGAITMGFASLVPSIPIGNSGFSLGISPQIAIGSDGVGFGVNTNLGYDIGAGFKAGISAGATYYAKATGTGHSGFEGRIGYGLDYGFDYNFFGEHHLNIGIGSTYFFSGETTQHTGNIHLGGKSWRATYENDTFAPVPGLWTFGGHERDKYRTAAARLDFTRGSLRGVNIGLNIFTGKADNTRNRDGSFHEEIEYRFGALYIGYGSLRIGYNSERNIREPIQNYVHDKNDYPHFRGVDIPDKLYIGIYSPNPYTLW